MDNFYEQLNRAEGKDIYKSMKVLSFVFLGIAFMSLNFTSSPLIFLVTLVIGASLFFLKKKFLLEYEYDFTNGEIDIDVIIEAKKRKRVISFDVKSIEAYGPEIDMVKYKAMGKNINAIATNEEKKVYGAYFAKESTRYYLSFTPDEKFYELIRKYNRRSEIR